jgi:hypothetical protein
MCGSDNSIDFREKLMLRILELQMKCINVLSIMDFKQRDLFEFKDYVQNDGTNDYYKHFLVYQYITMLSYIAELKYVEVLD